MSQTPIRFTHVRAWAVVGGIGMPQGISRLVLAETGGGIYSLEKDITEQLTLSDRGQAIGHAMLAAIVGQAKGDNAEERLTAALADLRQERSRKIGSSPVLLFVGQGGTNLKGAQRREEGDYVVTFDAIDKLAIRDRFNHGHRSMQLALALESSSRVRFNEVAIGTYCTTPDGKVLYSINMSGSAEGSVSTSLPESAAESINRRFSKLNQQRELGSTVRLFADMAMWGRDPFRAFISGWTALEILIKKTFREYEEAFYGGLSFPHHPEMTAQFVKRIREAVGRSPSVKDQFLVMSAVLLPRQSREDAHADIEAFRSIKKLRDQIAHGEEFRDAQLPIHELNRLLTKYVAAHADRATQGVEALGSQEEAR